MDDAVDSSGGEKPIEAEVEATGGKPKPKVLHLYLDETGSRHLDKDGKNTHPRWFALGGLLVEEESEADCKLAFKEFFSRWPQAREPLHLTDMRAERKNWSWLGRLGDEERTRFWSDYRGVLARLPVGATACVIDRPGYRARGYGGREGDKKWLLCRSAFDILTERAVKVAGLKERRLRVFYEGVNPEADERTEGYFHNLKENGLEFDAGRSAKYGPLSKGDLKFALLEISRKDKRSKMMQFADSYVYALSRGGYEKKFDIFRRLAESGRLVTSQVPGPQAMQLGIKYYCFDGV